MVQRGVVALTSCMTLVNCLNGGIAFVLLRTLIILTQSLCTCLSQYLLIKGLTDSHVPTQSSEYPGPLPAHTTLD